MAVINLEIRANTSGSREAVNALNGALRGIGEASTQAQRANAQLGDTARRVGEDAQRQKKSWSDLAVGFNQALELMNKGLQALSGAYKATVGSAVEFEKGLAEISTLYDSTTESQAKLGKEVLALQKQFGGDSQTIIKGYYDALSSGAVNATNAQDFLTAANKLAIGGATDVSTAIDGMTSVVNGFALKAEDASKISDIFFIGMKAGKTTVGELSGSIGNVAAIANSLGVSFGETVSAMSAMTLAGKTANETSTMLRQTFVELLKPGASLAKAMADAGIESAQLSIEQDGLEKTLKKIVGTTDGTAASLGKLFGSAESLSAVLSLTGAQADAFSGNLKTVGDAALNAGATTEEAFQKMAASVSFQMNVLRGKVQATFTEIGIVILPLVAKALEFTIKAFNGLTEAVVSGVNFYKDYKDIIDAIAVGLLAGGFAFGAYTLAINATAIATGALTAVTTAFTAVMTVLTSPVTLTVAAIAALTAGIYLAYKNFDLITAYAKQFAGLALKTLAPAITLATDMFYAMKQGVDIVVASIKVMAGTYAQFASFLLGNVVKAFDVYLMTVQKVVGVFDKDLAQSIANARKTIENVSNSVKNSAKAFTDSSKEQLKSAQATEEYAKKALATDKAIKELSKSLEEGGKAELASIKAKKDSIKAEEEAKKSKDAVTTASTNATAAINQANAATKASIPVNNASTQAEKANTDSKKELADAARDAAKAKEELAKATELQATKELVAYNAHKQYAQSMKESAELDKKRAGGAGGAGLEGTPAIDGGKPIEIEFEPSKGLGDKLKETLAKAYSESAELLESSLSFLPGFFGEMVGSIGSVIGSIGTELEPVLAPLKKGLEDAFTNALNSFGSGIGSQASAAINAIAGGIGSTLKVINSTLLAGAELFGAGMQIISGGFVDDMTKFLDGFANAPASFMKSLDGLEASLKIFDNEGLEQAKAVAESNLVAEQVKLENISKESSLLEQKLAVLEKEQEAADNLASMDKAQVDARLSAIALEQAELKLRKDLTAEEIKEKTAQLNAEKALLKDGLNASKEDRVAKLAAIKSQIEATKNEISSKKDLIKQQETSVEEQSKATEEAGAAFANSFTQMVDKLVARIPEVVNGFVKALPTIINKIVSAVPKIINAIVQALPQIINSLVSALPTVFNAVITALPTIFKAIVDALPTVITAILEAIPTIIEALGEMIPYLIGKLPEIIIAILDKLPMIIMSIIDQLPAIIGAIIAAIPQIITAIIIALPQIIISLITGIIKNIPAIVSELFKGIWNSLFGKSGIIGQIGNSLIKPLNGVISFFARVGEWFVNAFRGVVNFFKGIVDFFAKIFKAVGDFISNLNPFNWFHKGGEVKGYSQGGVIQGKAFVQGDDKRNDTVMAMLSPGEIVIPRSATQGGYGAMVDYLAKLTGRTGYAQGGVVSTQSFADGGVVMNNSNSSGDITNAIVELEKKVERLGIEIIKYSKRAYDIIDKFDVDGMPQVRSY